MIVRIQNLVHEANLSRRMPLNYKGQEMEAFFSFQQKMYGMCGAPLMIYHHSEGPPPPWSLGADSKSGKSRGDSRKGFRGEVKARGETKEVGDRHGALRGTLPRGLEGHI